MPRLLLRISKQMEKNKPRRIFTADKKGVYKRKKKKRIFALFYIKLGGKQRLF